MKFNINNNVRVRLTPYGRQILNREKYPYHEDEFGWSTWQLWTLMSTLGQYAQMGLNLPFETKIEISEER